MGYSKKLYNVLGGVTNSIIPNCPKEVNTKNSQISQNRHFKFVHFIQTVLQIHLW